MESRVWINLAGLKFRTIYTAKVSRRSYHIGNGYSIFLSLASATSVAAWAVWEAVPFSWATIIGISQVLHVIKPHLPYMKSDREFIEMYHLYESTYLEYEKIWYDNCKDGKDETK